MTEDEFAGVLDSHSAHFSNWPSFMREVENAYPKLGEMGQLNF